MNMISCIKYIKLNLIKEEGREKKRKRGEKIREFMM